MKMFLFLGFFVVALLLVLFSSKTWIFKLTNGLVILPQYNPDKTISIEDSLIKEGYIKATIITDDLVNSKWTSHTFSDIPISTHIPSAFQVTTDPDYQQVWLKTKTSKDFISISVFLMNPPVDAVASDYVVSTYSYEPYLRKRVLASFDLDKHPKTTLSDGKVVTIVDGGSYNLLVYAPDDKKFGYFVSVNNSTALDKNVLTKFLIKLAENTDVTNINSEMFEKYYTPKARIYDAFTPQ